MSQDEEHLKLLSIFHYVAGGITGFISCLPIIHFIIGLVMLVAGLTGAGDEERIPLLIFGFVFTLVIGLLILCGWALAICMIVSGRRLGQRRSYTFCFVIACISCLFMPYGTVLGVFTIIVLMRPTVKELFGISP